MVHSKGFIKGGITLFTILVIYLNSLLGFTLENYHRIEINNMVSGARQHEFKFQMYSVQVVHLTSLSFDLPLDEIGEGNGNPLQCTCLENPRDKGAWWAVVYGVAQSRTQLKRLSHSSRRNGYKAST